MELDGWFLPNTPKADSYLVLTFWSDGRYEKVDEVEAAVVEEYIKKVNESTGSFRRPTECILHSFLMQQYHHLYPDADLIICQVGGICTRD